MEASTFVRHEFAPLSLVEGSTENATLVRDLLVELRERGLVVCRPSLAVSNGAKALSTAVREVFDQLLVQHCLGT